MRQPSGGHSLTDGYLFHEVFFQPGDLPVEKVIGVLDEADGEVVRVAFPNSCAQRSASDS